MRPPTATITWIGRCIWRLKRLYYGCKDVPGAGRPLTWWQYDKLVKCILAEHRED